MLFCYPGPKFNVWRTWEDVTFEVNGSPYAPKVFGASEDDAHGLLDYVVKSYLLEDQETQETATDLLARIEKRAIARTEYFPSLFDLLTECPPIWNAKATSCTKVFSPFGRSCLSVSVPSNSKARDKAEVKVKLTVAYREKLPLIMGMGFALMYFARLVSKSKVLWYFSGISISVVLGIVILTVFLCRKIRQPPPPPPGQPPHTRFRPLPPFPSKSFPRAVAAAGRDVGSEGAWERGRGREGVGVRGRGSEGAREKANER